MPPADAAQQRLANQLLVRPSRGGPLDVVRSLGAMQAQDYTQSLWAIGSRLPNATVTDVTQAIEERLILRTWPMRGTIHFVPAEDVRWMLQVSAARTVAAHATRLAELEVDERTLQRCYELLHATLAGGRRVTRPRVMEIFEEAGIRTDGQRGYTLLWYAAHTGLICFGPMEGKQQTFVLLEEWVPDAGTLGKDDAIAALALRYFTSHGPATVHDFAWWASITVTDARRAVDANASNLASRSHGGAEHWTAKKSARPGGGALLLPGFDEMLLGYKDRSATLPPAYAQRIVPGGNGVFQPTMVLDGRVVGTWKRKVGTKSLTIELLPFEDVSQAVTEFEAHAQRFAAFVGVPLTAVTVTGRDVPD